MDFRQQASTETSALIARLLAGRAQTSLEQLQALRSALDVAARAAAAALTSAPQVDGEIARLVDTLSAAAAATAEASARKVADESNKIIGDLKAEVELHKEDASVARTQLTEMRQAYADADAGRARAEVAIEDEARARATVEEELQELRGLLDATLTESASAGKRLESEGADKAKLAEALKSAHQQRESINAMLKASNARVQALERAHTEDERTVADLKARLDNVTKTEAQHTAESQKDVKGARAEAEALREEVLEFGLLLEQLVGAFQSLAKAGTIAEVLGALVKQLTTRFARVALFRVKGNRLEGEHQAGFDSKSDIANVAMPLSVDSLLTRAVASGAIESLAGPELADSSRAPFGGTPTCALALPLVIGGAPFAVVYADDSGKAEPEHTGATLDLRSTFAELLLRHTTALLMRLTTELKALAELREYATTLLNEAEHMYGADVDAGKSGKDLQNRLKENVECARRIYMQRIAHEGPTAATLLEERLAEVVEAQKGTSFGKDLALVARGAEQSSQRRTAEAS